MKISKFASIRETFHQNIFFYVKILGKEVCFFLMFSDNSESQKLFHLPSSRIGFKGRSLTLVWRGWQMFEQVRIIWSTLARQWHVWPGETRVSSLSSCLSSPPPVLQPRGWETTHISTPSSSSSSAQRSSYRPRWSGDWRRGPKLQVPEEVDYQSHCIPHYDVQT